MGAGGAEGAVGGAFGAVDDAEWVAFFVEDVDSFCGDVAVAYGGACEPCADLRSVGV